MANLNQALTSSQTTAVVARPAEPAHRLLSLDAARGFALFGIFCVNAAFFAMPLGDVLDLKVPVGLSTLDTGAWYFVNLLCTGKFYPLFALIFGYGLALQMGKRANAGLKYGWMGVRRLLFLTLVGLLHAFFIWHGDILFIYGTLGLVLLAMLRCRPRTLVIAAAVFLAISMLAGALMGALGLMGKGPAQVNAPVGQVDTGLPEGAAQLAAPAAPGVTQEAAVPAAASAVKDVTGTTNSESITSAANSESTAGSTDSTEKIEAAASTAAQGPAARFLAELRKGTVQDPSDPRWKQYETQAMRDGPWADAMVMRAVNWVIFMVVTVVNIGWQILAMFCLGAVLAKVDFLGSRWEATRALLTWPGVPIAVAASCALSMAPTWLAGGYGEMLILALMPLVFGCMSFTMLCAASVLVVRFARAGRVVAAVGRMAFTNYVLQSLICTAIMYHWGLGQFANWGHAALLGLVVAVYAAQVVFSVLWLSKFEFGPLEWVWRTITYLRLPGSPQRAGGGSAAGAAGQPRI